MPIKEFEPVVKAMSLDDHLRLASKSVKAGLTSMRDAAEHLAAATALKATQRQLADAVGKSPAWVNGLLQWRKAGYPETPFGPQSKSNRQRNKAGSVQATKQKEKNISEDDADESNPLAEADESYFVDQDEAPDTSRLDDDETPVVKRPSAKGARSKGSPNAGFDKDARAALIRALEQLYTMNPQARAKAASEINRIKDELRLSWDQLIVPAATQIKQAA
jgi:hypothetical protein